jgi:hypothetical protein
MSEPQGAENLELLRERIARANEFVLYRQYGEAEAAEFLKVHPQTLKKLRLEGKIEFLRIGKRAIAYFGFQIADYLIGAIEWRQRANPSTNSAKSGSARAAKAQTSIDTGGTPTEDAQDALRLARQTLKKPKRS